MFMFRHTIVLRTLSKIKIFFEFVQWHVMIVSTSVVPTDVYEIEMFLEESRGKYLTAIVKTRKWLPDNE